MFSRLQEIWMMIASRTSPPRQASRFTMLLEDDITDTQTVLWPAENRNVSSQLLRVSAAVIIFIIRLRET